MQNTSDSKRREFLKTSGKIALASMAMTSGVAPVMAHSNKGATNQNQNKAKPNQKGASMQTIKLNNGVKMPILGYGTYQIPNNAVQRCVEDAISVGYRLIDTAQAYANEEGIGAAIKTALNGGIKRDELFIETKLWISHTNQKDALKAFDLSCKKLGVDYVDLYIIHQPYNDTYGAWRAMSKLHKECKIRAIGVSNFYPDTITDFCMFNDIKPAINQIELHPLFQKVDEQKINNDLGVAVQSWASFAEGKGEMFSNKVLQSIGEKYDKTPAQVILRWLIERNIAVIPKTTRLERMKENFAVFDFKLTQEDKTKIAKLDTGKTQFIDHRDPERVKWLANYKAK
ncbi:aldo/keto reductase [Helicobacter sp. 23-1048]